MLDVILAQLDAASASLAAARALLQAQQPPAEPPHDGICRHPVKLPTGRPGAWVCQDCSFNYPTIPEEGA